MGRALLPHHPGGWVCGRGIWLSLGLYGLALLWCAVELYFVVFLQWMKKGAEIADLRWGAGWGLSGAFFYAFVAVAIYAIRGSTPFEANGVPLALGGYLVGGLIAGGVVGLLRPLNKRRSGAVLVGMIASLPAMLGLGLVAFGPIQDGGSTKVLSGVLTAVLLGGYTGWEFWEP